MLDIETNLNKVIWGLLSGHEQIKMNNEIINFLVGKKQIRISDVRWCLLCIKEREKNSFFLREFTYTGFLSKASSVWACMFQI